MAPKTKKLRQSRMCAAIDAMRPFGFSPKTVQAKVRALLKEYGGDDCWPFIESDAYTLLITSILEEKDGEKVGEKSFDEETLLQAQAEAGIHNNVSGESEVGPSEQVLSPVGSETVDTASHIVQTVCKVKEEPSQTSLLETTAIISLKSPTFSMVQPKAENLNGWLIEEEEEDTAEPVKLTRAKKPSAIKRKRSDPSKDL